MRFDPCRQYIALYHISLFHSRRNNSATRRVKCMKISREPDACGIDCESGKGRSFVLNVFKCRLSIEKKKKNAWWGWKRNLRHDEYAAGFWNRTFLFYAASNKVFFPPPELESFFFCFCRHQMSREHVGEEIIKINEAKGYTRFHLNASSGEKRAEMKRIDKVSDHPRPITGYIYLPQTERVVI